MAPVAPNAWISVDIGWIWVGYIQDGLLGPFGPTKIAPGGLRGGQKWPKNAIKRAFMAISGISGHKITVFIQKLSFTAKIGLSCLKWVEHRSNWVEHYISHPGWLVETF